MEAIQAMSQVDRKAKVTEYSDWQDKGCEISNACLECPLPKCKHDDKLWYEKYLKLSKHRNLILDLQDYLYAPKITNKFNELAAKHNIATRTVFRMRRRLINETLDFDMIELFYDRLRR